MMAHIRDEIWKRYPAMFKNPKSRAQAIHRFCTECMGGARHEVKHCSDVGCPLFQFRPASKSDPRMGD